MNARPVLLRELRAEARNPISYWLRIVGAGVVIAAFAFLMWSQGRLTPQAGAWLFAELHYTLFFAVMIFAPLLTADCISREHREGTLGLLFLTPLTARDIVVGKSLIHSVRAFTLLVAALPILALPFVLGGVTGRAVLHAVALNLSGLLAALAAGLLATARNVEWIRAVVVAEILSAFFALALIQLPKAYAALGHVWTALSKTWMPGSPPKPWFTAPVPSSTAPVIGTRGGLASLAPYSSDLVLVLFAVLLFAWAVRRAGRHLEAAWQTDATAFGQPRWVNLFSASDFWKSIFRWNKGRTLDRNPIAWLQEYSWTARLTKWGWCFVVLGLETIVLLDISTSSFFLWQSRLTMLLGIGLAFSAVASFHRERQTGTLELMLVAPLKPADLIRGRLWGLLGHFFPAFAIVMLCWFFAPFESLPRQRHFGTLALALYVTVPVIGIFFSMLRVNFFVAWLLTCALGVVLPFAAANNLRRPFWLFARSHFPPGTMPSFDLLFFGVITGVEILWAGCALFLLYRNLVSRTFALHESGR